MQKGGRGLYRLINSKPGFTVTAAQASPLVGRSKDTILRWVREGRVEPTEWIEFGGQNTPVFDIEGIGRLQRLAESLHPGRKKQ